MNRSQQLCKLIKANRLELKMTQEDLSRKCGVLQTTISKIECNQHSPSLELYIKLLSGLDKHIEIHKGNNKC
ncbi:MAG: helix-turn-helix transcriptional regulator [Nanoarchaeota archaeon]|nr:helix-turn-helix transcriptional regulator [Nanoarchaeota archaeon]